MRSVRGVKPTRHGNVVTVQRGTFLRALDRELGELGLTREEFLSQGRDDSFTDERARSLWSMVDPGLLEP